MPRKARDWSEAVEASAEPVPKPAPEPRPRSLWDGLMRIEAKLVALRGVNVADVPNPDGAYVQILWTGRATGVDRATFVGRCEFDVKRRRPVAAQ